jgi:hypothetical protein
MSKHYQNNNMSMEKKPPPQELIDAGIPTLPRYVLWNESESKFVIDSHPALKEEVKQGLRKKPVISGSKSQKLTIIQKFQDILARLQELDKQNTDDISILVANIELEPKRRTAPGRKAESKLPDDCGINISDMPKHCYYKPASKERGDMFVIDGHPKLTKRAWTTTSSKKKTTLEKFQDMMNKYNEIEITE